jgi:hypothetical protein
VARQFAGRDQDGVEAHVANGRHGVSGKPDFRAAAIRCFCRSAIDSAASSSFARAFTSTKTNVWRRAAIISISPSALFQRRANMR